MTSSLLMLIPLLILSANAQAESIGIPCVGIEEIDYDDETVTMSWKPLIPIFDLGEDISNITVISGIYEHEDSDEIANDLIDEVMTISDVNDVIDISEDDRLLSDMDWANITTEALGELPAKCEKLFEITVESNMNYAFWTIMFNNTDPLYPDLWGGSAQLVTSEELEELVDENTKLVEKETFVEAGNWLADLLVAWGFIIFPIVLGIAGVLAYLKSRQ